MPSIKLKYFIFYILSAFIYCADIVKIENRAVKINNDYFFPIAVWMQGPKDIAYQKSLGINTFILNGDRYNTSTKEFLDSCESNSVWGIVNPIDSRLNKHNALLGWFIMDEPDVKGENPNILIKKHKELKKKHPNLITFLNLGPGFTRNNQLKIDPRNRASISNYKKFTLAADLIGFDYYPVYFCEPEKIHLVGDLQKEFSDGINNNRPSFQWVECVSGTDPFCNNSDRGLSDGINQKELRNQVWQSIINGATAIGYYTHYMDYGYSRFHVNKFLIDEMSSINKQIMKYASTLLNDNSETAFFSNNQNNIDILAKQTLNGEILFVINTSRKSRKVIISTNENLKEIIELEQNRLIIPNGNSFIDEFDELRLHIYLVKK